jgi:predicted GNAT family acetyltransferase
MSADSATVVHRVDLNRFEIAAEGLRCELLYRINGPVMHLFRTFVPPALEGRGMAAALVAAAMDHARATGLRIAPDCSYVRTWLQRHPEHHDLWAPDAAGPI